MKNIGWIVIVFFCFQQAKSQEKLFFGLKAAPSISWLQAKSTDLDGSGAKIGFSYGLIADVNFSENYSFGTGIDFNQQGGEIKYPGILDTELATITENYALQYLEVPFTLKMRTKEIGYFTYYGRFGLGADVLISAKADTKLKSSGETVKEKDLNVYDDLRFFRASIIIGLGAEYHLSGSTRLIIGATYNNGFVNPLKGHVLQLDDNGFVVKGDKRKATSDFISIDLGVIF
jgi:hypothetical protein